MKPRAQSESKYLGTPPIALEREESRSGSRKHWPKVSLGFLLTSCSSRSLGARRDCPPSPQPEITDRQAGRQGSPQLSPSLDPTCNSQKRPVTR
ncbi:hypothetical protein LX32DRAFT_315277 [Colletotrichum zoysiae]|uniref:Uncharacterized protein n=1 Tax=Colletotrichum zoysiae TaxID=1216348 RepID=A0AAD9H260_9PEZI|nr:hypothetical protein LX32DRAFT_315277 [Colletotrichum zoysiae]